MSLAILFLYLMLNMFRMLIHPSSGACDLFVELFHALCFFVGIEAFALAYSFISECLVVTCVVVVVLVVTCVVVVLFVVVVVLEREFLRKQKHSLIMLCKFYVTI